MIPKGYDDPILIALDRKERRWKITLAVALTIVALALAYGFGFLLFQGIIDTGPNCPGADPEWLGWCSRAPLTQ